MKVIKKTILSTVFLVPAITFAQVAHDAKTILGFAGKFINRQLIPMLITLALVYALYNGIDYIRTASEDGDNEEKKKKLMWSIIGLFVIVSIWGLVAFVSKSLGIYVGGDLNAR